jgi:hypothetical protein
MTSALEFHDSTVVKLTVNGKEAIIELAPGYVHQWERQGDDWLGTGWSKPVQIRVASAHVTSPAPTVPADVSDGSLTVGSLVHSNLVPLPFRAEGHVRLHLLFGTSDALEVTGTGVSLDVTGEGAFVEDLPHEWAPSS